MKNPLEKAYIAGLAAAGIILGAGAIYAASPSEAAFQDVRQQPGFCTDAGPRDGHRPPRFEDLDTNGDGKLSPEEASKIPPMTRERFNEADKDGDGYLTGEEIPRPPRPPRDGRTDGNQMNQQRDNGFQGSSRGPRRGWQDDDNRPAPPPGRMAWKNDDSDRPGPPPGFEGRMGMPGGERPPRPEDLDKDGDWKLSREEAAALPGMTDERFKEADRDGDGKLTIGEVPPPPPPGMGHGHGPGKDFQGGPGFRGGRKRGQEDESSLNQRPPRPRDDSGLRW